MSKEMDKEGKYKETGEGIIDRAFSKLANEPEPDQETISPENLHNLNLKIKIKLSLIRNMEILIRSQFDEAYKEHGTTPTAKSIQSALIDLAKVTEVCGYKLSRTVIDEMENDLED